MGAKDISQKKLISYNDVFADIANVVLFKGKRRIEPSDLTDISARSAYREAGELREEERDVCKLWRSGGAVISMIGIENQSTVDYDMPLRVIGYDGQSYHAQLDMSGKLCRYPVLTIVLYFGKGCWTGPRTLFERICVSEELRPFVSDYRINVFEVSLMTEDQVGMFRSDFRIAADYFSQMNRNDSYTASSDEIRHVDAVLKLMSAMSGDRRFEEVLNDLPRKKGVKVSMQSVFDRVESLGVERGIGLGIEKGIGLGIEKGIGLGIERGFFNAFFGLVHDNIISAQDAAVRTNVSLSDFLARMEEWKAGRAAVCGGGDPIGKG